MNDLAVLTDPIPEGDTDHPEPRDAWIFPTSFAQRRLWFIDLADPGNPLYNFPSAFNVHGRLDHALLDRAFADVIARHEILRTTYHPADGEPMQLVSAISDFRLPSFDLRSLAGPAREAEVSRIIREQSELPFDLRNGPLLRAALLDLAPSEQLLVICLHLSLTDCFSQEILMSEVMSAYSSMAKGEAPSFPELPIQYADFSAWQRDAMRGETLEQELGFWREKLAGLAPIDFPDLPPQPTAAAPEAATFRFELPEPLCAALRSMAQAEAVTPFMALLAGWKIFLSLYTGQTDLAVSSPVSGRNRTETEGLIGPFLNTLILRTSLAGNPSVRDILHRVRDTALEAFTHQDLPFEVLADHLQPEPPPGKNPLLRVLFNLMTGEEKTYRAPDTLIEPLPLAEPSPRFDLMLRLRDTGRAIRGALVYDHALFAPETIEHIASQYESLLAGMAAHPEIALNSFHLVPATGEAPRDRRGGGGETRGLVDGRAQSPDWPPQAPREAPISAFEAPHPPQSPNHHPHPVHQVHDVHQVHPVHPVHPVHDAPAPAPAPHSLDPAPPQDYLTWMEGTLTAVWQEVLHRNPIAVTDDFFDLGGNSLLAIRMLVEAEKRTGIHIAPRLVFEFPTIRRLAVEARHPEARAHSPIVTVQNGGSSAPFFFLHGDYVEGGLYCVKIARHLGQDRPFYAIDPHGVHDAPLDTVEEMAASRLELVRKLRPRGPYVLGGYCNGALVAFEMARQLQAAGETVSSLILISAEPPNAEFAWLDRLIGRRASDGSEKLRALPRWRAAWRRYLAALAAPVPVSQKPRRFARKAVRLVWKVFGLMRPYRGPAHLLWPGELPRRDSTAGWGSVIPQIELIEVPGGHFTALQGENLLALCENLRSCLLEDQA